MQRVTLYHLEPHSTRYQYKEAYAPNPERPLFWLQRLCCRILDKLGAWYYQDRVQYQTVDMNLGDLVQALYTNVRDIRLLTGKQSKYLIVGRQQQMEILKWADPFYVRVDASRFNRIEFYGLTVVCVPWIDGLFVLPDLES